MKITVREEEGGITDVLKKSSGRHFLIRGESNVAASVAPMSTGWYMS